MKNSPVDQTPVHLYVIIPAAGHGRRMGNISGKQFIPIGGIPVLARTLLAFEHFYEWQKYVRPFSIHGILVTSEESIEDAKNICEEYKIHFIEKVIVGGSTRQASVWNGVCALTGLANPPGAEDIVFIHDGARCFIDSNTLLRCLNGAREHGVCTAAIPVKDTIKQVESQESGKVTATPNRSTLYAVQTPQAFLYPLLVDSYTAGQNEKRVATDDTSLAEAIGIPVYLVEGDYTNIKITTPEDLEWAELLKTRQNLALP